MHVECVYVSCVLFCPCRFLASVDECQRVYKEAVKLREHELKREQKRLAAEQKRLALSRQNSVAKAAGESGI